MFHNPCICVGDSRGESWPPKADLFSKCIILCAIFVLLDKSTFRHPWSKAASKDYKHYTEVETKQNKQTNRKDLGCHLLTRGTNMWTI